MEVESFIRNWDFLKVFEAEEWLDWASIFTDYDGVHSANELKTAVQINMVVAYNSGNIDEEKMDSHSRGILAELDN